MFTHWDSDSIAVVREAGAQVVDLDGSSHTLSSKATIAVVPALGNEILDLLIDAQTSAAPGHRRPSGSPR